MPRGPSAVTAALLVLLTAAGCTDGAMAPRSTSASPVAAASSPNDVPPATPRSYANKASSTLCMAVAGAQTAPATKVVLAPCGATAGQQFQHTAAAELRAMSGSMCVDASGGMGRVGDRVIIWPCHGGTNQKWTWTSTGQLQGVNKLCIAPSEDSSVTGANLVLAACSSSVARTWDAQVSAASTQSAAATGPGWVATIPVPADSFVNSIGVNTHLSWMDRNYYKAFSTVVLPKLRALGVRHIRDGAPAAPNKWWMSAVYGHYQTLAAATGAKFTLVVSPALTDAGPGSNYSDASHLRTVLQYAGADNVEAFEGLNEHDQSWRATWAAEVRSMQQALWTTVKSDPSLASRYKVLGPTLVYSASIAAVGNLSAYMDAGAFHPYPGSGTPFSAIPFNKAKYAALLGTRASYATETGYTNAMLAPTTGHQPVPEAVAAKYLPRLFLENFNAGIARSFAYELMDIGTDRSKVDQNFGLLRADGAEKPAYGALRNAISLLADPGARFTPATFRYALVGDTTGVHRTLLQKRDGRTYLVLWQDAVSYNQSTRQPMTVPAKALTLQLAQAARTITSYTPLTGAAPGATVARAVQFTVAVPDHPVVIEIAP